SLRFFLYLWMILLGFLVEVLLFSSSISSEVSLFSLVIRRPLKGESLINLSSFRTNLPPPFSSHQSISAAVLIRYSRPILTAGRYSSLHQRRTFSASVPKISAASRVESIGFMRFLFECLNVYLYEHTTIL